MSVVHVTITVEVNGPLGEGEGPAMQQWKFRRNAWDNRDRYNQEVAAAVAEASERLTRSLNSR